MTKKTVAPEKGPEGRTLTINGVSVNVSDGKEPRNKRNVMIPPKSTTKINGVNVEHR